MNLLIQPSQSSIQVSARSLFPYIALPRLSYDQWAEYLVTQNPFKYFRLGQMEDQVKKLPGGELVLTLEYATFCLQRNVPDIITAMGMLLVAEALDGIYGEGPECVNCALDSYSHIARNYGMIGAQQLQRFLGVNMDHDLWMAALKKKHKMRVKADYLWYKLQNGDKIMVFLPLLAMEVACGADTPRGIFIKNYSEAKNKERAARTW